MTPACLWKSSLVQITLHVVMPYTIEQTWKMSIWILKPPKYAHDCAYYQQVNATVKCTQNRINRTHCWFGKEITNPVQWMQKVGLKYVVSWKSCLKHFLRAWQLARMKYVFISALLIRPSLSQNRTVSTLHQHYTETLVQFQPDAVLYSTQWQSEYM